MIFAGRIVTSLISDCVKGTFSAVRDQNVRQAKIDKSDARYRFKKGKLSKLVTLENSSK